MLVDEAALPPRECDLSRVLLPEAMLREQRWPLLPPGLDETSTVAGALVHASVGNDGANRRRCSFYDLRIAGVERKPQLKATPVVCERAVTEVESEQVDIRRNHNERMFAPPGDRTPLPPPLDSDYVGA